MRLAVVDPGNVQWQNDLSISYDKIGNVLRDQGRLAEALAAYRSALRYGAFEHGGSQQHSVAARFVDPLRQNRRILKDQGDLANAMASYRKGLAIAENLVAADAGNTQWQRDSIRLVRKSPTF